jgi:transcriptional regulator with XRE-family HTH domain
MIKNERQYRITKAQLASFQSALDGFSQHASPDLHELIRKAQEDALRSQRDDLKAELDEYEALRSNRPPEIEARDLDELPRALIRARIALGLSQRELADKLGIKEQQIQRYESTDYDSASMARVREVAAALGVRVAETVFLPVVALTADALFSRLNEAGIDRALLLDRILPSEVAVGLESNTARSDNSWVERASAVIERIYGWNAEQLSRNVPLELRSDAAATARFKIPGGSHGRRLHAYIAYAHYLTMVVAGACTQLVRRPLELDAIRVRASLVARDPNLGLRSVLEWFWDQGVPVLPLSDAGAFHGACWRIAGRNVVVVKHRSRFLARWIFDLLHEWFHAGQEPDQANHSWIEDADVASTRRTSPDEQAASRFAGNVVLDARAEELTARCVEAAGGQIPRLKAIVPRIAEEAGVGVDHLANYLAWRLSLQGLNWWGTANNLQTQIGDPCAIARAVFYERFDFSKVNPIDAKLLHRALQVAGDAE